MIRLQRQRQNRQQKHKRSDHEADGRPNPQNAGSGGCFTWESPLLFQVITI